MRVQAWSMLPVPSALRIMASSRVGNAGAQDSIASDSGTPLRSSLRMASYRAFWRASMVRSSAMMRNARTSGTPAVSRVPRLRQKSASTAVFSGRNVAWAFWASCASVMYRPSLRSLA